MDTKMMQQWGTALHILHAKAPQTFRQTDKSNGLTGKPETKPIVKTQSFTILLS
jgi:hypothetical protein